MMYSLVSSVSEPIADTKIVKVIENFGGTLKVLLGIMVFISVLLVIGIAIILKISNTSLMYR